MSDTNIEIARRYLRALESGAAGPELAGFFDPELVYTELPNRLVPEGATRDLSAVLAASERGRLVVENQRYEVRDFVAQEDGVALQVKWSATHKVPFGKTPVGGTMRADSAVFLRFRGGRVIAQRNYDCFHEF